MPASSGTLREHLSVFYRHRRKMAVFFLGTMILVTLGIILCPRTYESQAMLHVLIGRENVSIDPTAATSPTITMMESRENEINTVKDLLQSRTVLDEVVSELGAQNILNPEQYSDTDKTGNTGGFSLIGAIYDLMLAVNLADPIGENERAALQLANDVKVRSEPESNVIQVAFRSETPEFSQRLGEVFLAAYSEQHSRAHRTQGSQGFFIEQSHERAAALASAEQKLRDLKNKFGIVTIGARQLTLSKQLEQVETDLLSTASAIAGSKAKIQALRQSLAEIPERLVTEETTESSQAADTMRNTLYDLQIREQELSAKHTDQHPLVMAIRHQAAEAKRLLNEEEKRRVQPTSSLNPANQQQKLALFAELALISGLEARYTSVKEQREELLSDLEKLNQQEIEVAELEREVSLLRNEYMTYMHNTELARINLALEAQSISNVNVVQPPTFVEKPVSPRKSLIMVLGFLIAVSGAIGLALLCENLQADVIRSPADMETVFGAPVMESIPSVQLRNAGVSAK
ncbi:GumC family protein [Bythopirellula polymerisocia]|uniref:Cryptic autophosphorylating protein tyrosine kinase Etk n=1 Tax=Bythopirellula polymerisocia TaxID=2528003 RepID=A0A5C6CBR2_9BACT|nr:GNVR domain-containing protein [Bythopirellula polymerisocia]TWU20864.1 cryptic autophosphorylating protein tyrosine kinase Etk [Bythopirellula polymerisocia]